jgi:hypothetical protein
MQAKRDKVKESAVNWKGLRPQASGPDPDPVPEPEARGPLWGQQSSPRGEISARFRVLW